MTYPMSHFSIAQQCFSFLLANFVYNRLLNFDGITEQVYVWRFLNFRILQRGVLWKRGACDVEICHRYTDSLLDGNLLVKGI